MSAARSGASTDLTWAEVHAAVVVLMKGNNWVNALCVAREYLFLVAFLGGAWWLYTSWAAGAVGALTFIPLALLLIFAIAAVQHRLSGLGHEAGHYTLFRN